MTDWNGWGSVCTEIADIVNERKQIKHFILIVIDSAVPMNVIDMCLFASDHVEYTRETPSMF